MSLFTQLTNKIAYTVHNAVYDPAAERYAAQVERARESEAVATGRTAAVAAENEQAAEKRRDAEKRRAVEEAERARRAEFSSAGMASEAAATAGKIIGIFVLLMFAVLGASLATNINIYKPTIYRVLYAFYGFVFFWIVIPYVFIYRWYIQGKRPRFYALLPLVPYRWDGWFGRTFLSWMSFRPDDAATALKEWEKSQSTIAG
jgi:lipopolysaccharide export LptBFGC system permease protein LptF